ncbi:SOS response-associated peptidase [Paenibacillus allorhizosphaerae]|uniref:Abasic site processing protein n=1 Tax=Paenibacillus allorhizosphaerae TaxID=2849866 RepID=A0ABM8VDJ6_9BACL|nr:SOS response-associated peptidase [Paenibacillus allorhizosphaerae]CAG7628030.1 hypothetical protein PAECIP111802_01414 [Paenibacillus allorhizosphaerae]
MYNRYSLTADISELIDYFRVADSPIAYKPSAYYTPMQQIPVICHVKGEKRLQEFRWGLMPFWAKDAVNADSEFVMEKRAYRRIVAKQRCIIPCTSFDVRQGEGKDKQSMRITLRDKKLFGIAGLYELWRDSRGNEEGKCTLLTTRANRLIYEYSHAMPAILRDDEMESWLDSDRNQDTDYLQTLLKPYHPELMRAFPVRVKTNGLTIEPKDDIEALPAKYAVLK